MTRKRTKADDPFRRSCETCGAAVGKPCSIAANGSKPLIPRAARLVHAARLEERPTDA